MSAINSDYSLYIHIPWCIKKCPYCDFNSHQKRDDYDEPSYVDALIKDLKTEAKQLKNRRLSSIFIGGGTPSLFSAASIERVLNATRQELDIADSIEITLEANPGTAEAAKFSAFRQIGINRLSIGIQSFNDQHLTTLGRVHDADQAHQAIDIAKKAGFQRINLDLMFGLPNQSLEQAVSDIETALAYQTDHLSYYQLTLEKNTLFHHYPPTLPHDDLIWDIQQTCQERITQRLSQYEVSAYASQHQQSQHNLNYWAFGDYVGIGAGAHGKLTLPTGEVIRRWKNKLPQTYMQHAGSQRAIGGEHAVPKIELPFEFMMNALRLKSGFTLHQFQQQTHLSPSSIQPTLNQLIKKNLLQLNKESYSTTQQGWNFLNDVLEHFLPPA